MTETIKEAFRIWSTDPYFSKGTRDELAAIRNDENEITERFYKNLEFGTGGLRGIIGAGLNRMNIYTVALVTEGFARYIDGLPLESKMKGVAISYDSRHFSREFAMTTALIFATHGIKVYFSDEIRPTPMLSYAVRHFGTIGGVMITASHNPAKYNGYKAYGEDGGQMPPDAADIILASMASIEDIRSICWITEDEAVRKGLLTFFGEELDDSYISMLKELCINCKAIADNADMRIVYTPLHGTGNKPVRRILKEIGFIDVIVVPEQELPDPDFSTVKSPNPEERSALQLAIDLAGKTDAELVVATDPDGDRTGLAIRDKSGEYVILSGNQIGVLLLDYILKAKARLGILPADSFAITTIVSTKLSRLITAKYDVRLFEVLTGFKFIAEIIKEYDEFGDMHFQFGFEESFGFLAGTQVRDKDAIVTIMLIAEMAAVARSEGKTLYDSLQELFAEYSYAAEKTISIMYEGKEGIEKIDNAMKLLRDSKSGIMNGISVSSISDFLLSDRIDFATGTVTPIVSEKSNVLCYQIGNLDWFGIRPSGTEPKIKIYFGIYGRDETECNKRLEYVSSQIEKHVRGFL
ncbi:MAG: phospho-sugar mutase [Saccharofermentanales bacterium]